MRVRVRRRRRRGRRRRRVAAAAVDQAGQDGVHLHVVDLLEVELDPLDPLLQVLVQLALLLQEAVVHPTDLPLGPAVDRGRRGGDLRQQTVPDALLLLLGGLLLVLASVSVSVSVLVLVSVLHTDFYY